MFTQSIKLLCYQLIKMLPHHTIIMLGHQLIKMFTVKTPKCLLIFFILFCAFQDIRAINGEAVHAAPRKTGMIVLGGGLPKHHICNANMMRNGADYAVFINTGQEFDGSDSGAQPDEAISWGKIHGSASPVKVCVWFIILGREGYKKFH